ncbi:hypothetical protein SAMN05892883_0373 [Jatrophihabitans sp. GAS493]|uniref:ATP-binding protein n=1 Tax=Jatrophihabitans sp. GAS493 TaxID=1907575 RepID=UPI000BB8C320|nr:ATP-binding protein [Jatrophihabitans sp. GAS493]SOD70717.1 hypothetical protein SAMN05892883_0373 [Jatrophihabitans sp. GAS493]
MDVVVGAGGCLTDVDFDQHLRPSGPGLLLDLRQARFVDPFGLVALAALTDDAVRAGVDVKFLAPLDASCAHYLHRMGVADLFDGFGVAHRLPAVRRNDLGDRLFELQRFGADAEAADLLAEQVFRIFAADEPATARELYNSVSELANNVLEHSGESGGYLALQQFERSAEVIFAVSDAGCGLREALQRATSVRDDGHAIALAVRRHVTSTGEWGRGVGLNGLVRRTHRGGRLQLWSGRASGVFRGGRIVPKLKRHVASFHGTVVQARIARE